ncbi:hypothetical protein [Kitasatospora sp. NPDC047058]|uniref:hypothetical protein n=1 Tax=Kitasatospora sp. NPDC047058 TaxID=3155620 RepID=UPI0033F39A57
MADHEVDLESDFLAIHGIDQTDLDGPRWVRLGERIAAYGGVMARRVEQQREGAGPEPGSSQQQAGRGQEMDLTELRLTHPGLVSVTRAIE